MFRPHNFQTLVHGVPKIIISPAAYADMWMMVDEVFTEVGWLGTAVRKGQCILIEEVFVMQQECSATETSLTDEGIAEVIMRLMEEDDAAGIAVESPDYRANKIRFWGHSHVNMDTGPSGQDDAQMGHFRQDGCDWFLRGIFNKKGKAQFTMFYFGDVNLAVTDCEWFVAAPTDDDERRGFLKNELKDKVRSGYYSGGRTYHNTGETNKNRGKGRTKQQASGSLAYYGGRR